MRMLYVSTSPGKVLQRVATVHIPTIAFLGAICVLLSGQLFAQTPDNSPPSQETVCSGLLGKAFGLCNAYCEAQDCDVSPKKSCEKLRQNFTIETGNPIFPCDIPPPCEELDLTQEQIDIAVAAVITDIDNPWGNVGDFRLLLDRIEVKLGCTLQNQDDVDSARMLQEVLPQQTETCAEEGINYCGPGTSETNGWLESSTESACLNEACCEHDACYGVECIDGDCYWTTQTQECDDALIAVCSSGCELDTEGRIICSIARNLDARENPEEHPECAEPASCAEGPEPDCAGQTCSTFTTCNPGSGCDMPVCGSLAEGGGLCVEGTTSCADLADCTTSADCGGDGLCFVDSCCGRPVCAPASAFCPDIGAGTTRAVQRQVIGEGLTIGR